MTISFKAALAAALVGCVLFSGVADAAPNKRSGQGGFSGSASWYGKQHHGRRTASGERFNMSAMTAAHRSLPFGTKVRVTNRRNGKSVVVRINDRGPFARGRIIDLSRSAAAAIGMLGSGTAPVTLQVVGSGRG